MASNGGNIQGVLTLTGFRRIGFIRYVSRWIASAAIGVAAGTSSAMAADFPCPEPNKQIAIDAQVAEKIAADTSDMGRRLLDVPQSEKKEAFQQSIINLWASYPNADRIAVIQNFQSISCNILEEFCD
jgi:hypothetical protein